MTKKELKRAIVVLFFALAALTLIKAKGTSVAAQQPNPSQTSNQTANTQAQEEPKNLQVLKGMSRPQVITVMRSWSEGLGVECNYCHVRPFEADTPRKSVARLMQRDYVIDMKHKDGRVLGCADCHQGKPNLLRTRAFDGVLSKKLPDVRVLTGVGHEKLMQVMLGFTQSLGVKCTYCHTEEFGEDTPRKQVARFMMTNFTHDLVKQDGGAVGCSECHQGHGRLLSVLPFARHEEHGPVKGKEPAPKKPNS